MLEWCEACFSLHVGLSQGEATRVDFREQDTCQHSVATAACGLLQSFVVTRINISSCVDHIGVCRYDRAVDFRQ